MKTSWRFLLSMLGLGVLIGVFGLYFKIKQVSCFIGQNQQDHALVCQQLQSLIGSRLLFRDFYHDKQVLASTVITDTKEVFSINKIITSLDGSVDFYLDQTPPLYRIILDGSPRIFTNSGENRTDDPNISLPTLIDDQGIFMNDFNNNHQFLVDFFGVLQAEEKQKIKEISFLSVNEVRLVVDNYPNFIIHPDYSPVDQAKKFQIIYHQLNPKEIDLAIKEIDLRFELPVLKTYEGSSSAELLIDSQE